MPDAPPKPQAAAVSTSAGSDVEGSGRHADAASLLDRLERLEAQVQALRMSALAERRFMLDGESYVYHVARGNRTWDNERAVELPVMWSELRRHEDASVLEVGNVLGHYYDTAHPVLDKYERHGGVTWNEDVVEFRPPFTPELVLSVSTLEHVGFSESPRDLAKFRLALDVVAGWLAPGGRLVFTVPIGYNPAVGEYLDSPDPRRRVVRCLRRVTLDNLWVQADYDEVRDVRYNRPFPCANAIAIVELSSQ